jgi:hypothetical protein
LPAKRNDGALDGFLGHDQHFLHFLLDDAEGDVAHVFHRDALGDGVAADLDRQPGEPLVHGRIGLRLDADHADAGLERARRRRDAGDQAAAADRHDEHVELGHRLEHLEPDGALAFDDQRVLVRMHEDEVVALRELARMRAGLVKGFALQHHARAVHLGVLDLGVGRSLRHHDDRRDAEARRMVSDRLRVVARAHGDDAALSFRVGQPQQLVQRAALLEGRRELQVLELEVELAAGQAREGAGAQERRPLDGALDARGGGADGVERDHARNTIGLLLLAEWNLKRVSPAPSKPAPIPPTLNSACWSRRSATTRSTCSTRRVTS